MFDKWVDYRRKRDRNDDDYDVEEGIVEKAKHIKEKRPYAARNYEGYDPDQALESEWYRRYVSGVGWFKHKRHFSQFRRRFRMPYREFQGLVKLARDKNGFPTMSAVMPVINPAFSWICSFLGHYAILEEDGHSTILPRRPVYRKNLIVFFLQSLPETPLSDAGATPYN